MLRYIKKQSPDTHTVYLMRAEIDRNIDLMVVPEHDGVTANEHTITTLAPLHAVTPEALAAARIAWEPQFANLPRPYVMLSLGGATKRGRYTAAQWREILQRATALAGSGSLLITTSRRTRPMNSTISARRCRGPMCSIAGIPTRTTRIWGCSRSPTP